MAGLPNGAPTPPPKITPTTDPFISKLRLGGFKSAMDAKRALGKFQATGAHSLKDRDRRTKEIDSHFLAKVPAKKQTWSRGRKKQPTPKKGDIWVPRDKRRDDVRVEILAVSKTKVSLSNVQSGRTSMTSRKNFINRFKPIGG
jgi:hypothetical protein